MKTLLVVLQVFFCSCFVTAQPGINFYPHHAGNVWQYRSQFMGQVTRTDYMDSVIVDSVTHDRLLYGRINTPSGSYSTRDRIDTLGNLYNLNFQPNYPRYKLAADSGDSWVAGYEGDTLTTMRVSVTRIFQSYVFGSVTTVKVFRFDNVFILFGDTVTFWIGNEYLASGFGLVRSDIEPSDVHVLTGAIIDSVQYGVIVSMKEEIPYPQAFDVLENYPNPFNPTTTIEFSLTTESDVHLSIYDILGREIAVLLHEKQRAGTHKLVFNGSYLPSGVYFARLKAQNAFLVRKMILSK